jgi:hypothetical protein
MKRRNVLAGALCSAALLVVAAAPASAAVPKGNGLVDFGSFTCEGLGEVSVFGPRGNAATAFTTTGQHALLLSLEIDGSEPFSKTYGKRSGLTPITCIQQFEGGEATAVVALVPPQ